MSGFVLVSEMRGVASAGFPVIGTHAGIYPLAPLDTSTKQPLAQPTRAFTSEHTTSELSGQDITQCSFPPPINLYPTWMIYPLGTQAWDRRVKHAIEWFGGGHSYVAYGDGFRGGSAWLWVRTSKDSALGCAFLYGLTLKVS
eukprot:1177089-Prorocentrum_minimum.AAC.2